MLKYLRTLRDKLITHRFAIIVISIFLGASTAGWIITEFIPPNLPARREMFRQMWGDTAVRIIEFFRLYDPFHSFWYSGVMALFFIVILLCSLTRWKSFIMRSFRISPPKGIQDLERREPRLDISWNELKGGKGAPKDSRARPGEGGSQEEKIDGELVSSLYHKISSLFRKKGYHVVTDNRDGEFLFTAVAGRWRFFGEFLFHLGLIVLTAGGMIGSFWGKTEVQYGKRGDILPVLSSSYSLMVEDFEILSTEKNELLNYRSRVSVLDEQGDTLRTTDIKVNKPLKFSGFNIYQSSYYPAEQDFKSAIIEFTPEGSPHKNSVTLKPNEKVSLEGTPFTLEGKRFLPDFKMGMEGPFSASRNMANPAIEIEVVGGDVPAKGWLFLNYPQFSSLTQVPVRFNLAMIEPVYYTGLQISTSPGYATIMAGITLATIGLLLLYTFSYRSIKGLVNNEQLVIVGARCNWKVSFMNEFKALGKVLRKDLSEMLDKGGKE